MLLPSTDNSHLIDDSIRAILREILPQADWDTNIQQGMWIFAFPRSRHSLENQGFKLHISTRPEYREPVIRRSAEICVDAGIAFKVIASLPLWDSYHDKPYASGTSRWSYGKTLTLYPEPELFKTTALTLADALHEFSGPDILTDMPVPGSKCVFYRYGSFTSDTLISPDGEQIPDNRCQPFKLPPWITDPFEDTKTDTKHTDDTDDTDTNDTNPLSKYHIHAAILHSAASSVYDAERKAESKCQRQRVAIKEAREDTAVNATGQDSVDRLNHEFEILRKLEAEKCTPTPIERFRLWRNLYVVMEYVEGQPLITFLKNNNLKKHELMKLSYRVADAVATIHEHGILWGDLSSSNVLFNPLTHQVVLIDFELADFIDNASDRNKTAAAGTPEFIGDGSNPLKREIYALGLLLLWVTTPSLRRYPTEFQKYLGAFRYRVYVKIRDRAVLAVAKLFPWILGIDDDLDPISFHPGVNNFRWRYPKRFHRILRECLDFRPLARPTARAVADRLKEFGE